jgi:hypothetical protein
MRRIITPVLILILIALPLGKVQAAEDGSHPAPVTWEVIEKTIAEEILGEAEGCLFLRVSGAVAKINLDWSGGLQPVSEDEYSAFSAGYNSDNWQEIDEARLHVKDGFLYLDQLPLLDVSSYIEEDRRFYESTPQYEIQPMQYVVKQRQLSDGAFLAYIVTYLKTYIPPPYTPSYADVVLSKDGNLTRLPIDRGFRLEKVLENEDGSLWLSGTMKNGRLITEKSLFLVQEDLAITHLNALLKKNFIQVLGQSLNSVIINAQTKAMAPHVPLDGIPMSENQYNDENSGIINIDSSLKGAFRAENPAGLRQVYLSSNGSIYGIKDDDRELFNLTNNTSFPLAGDTDQYDHFTSQLEQAGNVVQGSPPRTDRDSTSWYVKDQRIIHRVGNREWVFNRGLDVLMYPVSNLFIDKAGGKWFLSPAGIAYYGAGSKEAVNMNPAIDGGLPVGDYHALYVDDQQKVWHFGEVIRCWPRGGHTAVAPQSSLIQGFQPVYHNYLEQDGKGMFVYQKENPDSTYCIKILTIDRQGTITEKTYRAKSPARQALMAGEALLIHLADGVLRVSGEQGILLTHQLIDENMTLQVPDPHTHAFTGPYKIVVGRL